MCSDDNVSEIAHALNSSSSTIINGIGRSRSKIEQGIGRSRSKIEQLETNANRFTIWSSDDSNESSS